MTIAINKMVKLSYTLRSNNNQGEIIEETSPEMPLQFVFGMGTMLPMFESNLAGMKQGENFEMSLAANDAYGEIDEDAIVELDKEVFMVNGIFEEERFTQGAQIPMQTADGQRLNGIVTGAGENSLTMDFNHPLAGMDLHFTGNIIEVRDATEEELTPSMGCGCGSGGCDSHDHGGCDDEGCGSGCGC